MPIAATRAVQDRRWGWLTAAGGAAIAVAPFLPWVSLTSGGITLTVTGMQVSDMTGVFHAHAYVVLLGGVALAVLGLLLVAGQEVRLPVLIVAALAVIGSIIEIANATGGQSRLTGGATTSVGIGIFLMFAGGVAGLAGVLLPELSARTSGPALP